MKGRYSKELSHAFVVSPDELEKMVELLQKRIGEVDISVKCADDFSREFNTVKELIAYENPKPKRIRSIHLSASSDNHSKSATIVFRDSFFRGVSIDINGREDIVSRLREEILDIAAGMRPWYNWIASANLFMILVIASCVLSFISAISILFEWIPISDASTSNPSNTKETAVSILLLLGVLLVLWGFHRLRNFLFPKLVFTIGQGEDQFRLLEKIRWVVIIGFGVSLTAGLVVSIITIFI